MTDHLDSVYRPVVPDERDVDPLPVVTKATDYPAGHVIERHPHARGQLVYAEHGVMMVAGDGGQWIVPPTRAIWMPPGVSHRIRCIGVVHMRSIYVRPDAAAHLPAAAQAVGVWGLVAELIRAAVKVPLPYAADSRDGRLMRLLLDELHALPVLPLHLPQPADERLRRICARLAGHPVRPVAPAGAPAARARAPGRRRQGGRRRARARLRQPERVRGDVQAPVRRAAQRVLSLDIMV